MLATVHNTPLSQFRFPIAKPPVLVIGVEGPASIVRCSGSIVHRPSSVRSITPTVLKIISPYCLHIFVMYVGCAQKDIVAPPIKLNYIRGQK